MTTRKRIRDAVLFTVAAFIAAIAVVLTLPALPFVWLCDVLIKDEEI